MRCSLYFLWPVAATASAVAFSAMFRFFFFCPAGFKNVGAGADSMNCMGRTGTTLTVVFLTIAMTSCSRLLYMLSRRFWPQNRPYIFWVLEPSDSPPSFSSRLPCCQTDAVKLRSAMFRLHFAILYTLKKKFISIKEIFIWIVAKKYFFETNNCLFDTKKGLFEFKK